MDQLIVNGWVEDINSPWGASIVPVPKSDGSIRLCIDYRALNSVTAQIQYPIPHLDDMLSKVGKARVLSKLDLCKGYYQASLSSDSRDLTAFMTPWGTFRVKILPFGLKNALMCCVGGGATLNYSNQSLKLIQLTSMIDS